MSRIKEFINNADINRFRFWFQIVAFFLFVYGGYIAFDLGMDLPTFACPYNDQSGGTCFLMGIQHRFAVPFNKFILLSIVISLSFFILWFILFSKSWCGFICPLGTMQDWITKLRAKTGIRYSTYSKGQMKGLGKIKYVLLALLILIPVAIGNSIGGLPKLSHDWGTPFCMICPGRTMLPLFTLDPSQLAVDNSSVTKAILSSLGLAITGIFLAGSFVKKRFFCLFCPMSALQYLFSKLGLLRLIKEGDKCTRCGNCYRACDMGIREIADDVEKRNMVNEDCMMCFQCVASCPEDECLKVTFLGKPVLEATETGFNKRMKKKTGSGDTLDDTGPDTSVKNQQGKMKN
jgi:polyferredoxin